MTTHAVVDGSNIATEGRSEPSLVQLREAVEAFRDEHDFDQITVIVDASFEHRVSTSERREARAAIEANEFITPPAGVIGRGDTFILQVADRAGAVVVSNDSFQEFHGRFAWLFDVGRLIGGKPIPGIGWVYVPRAPVRGPVSRRAQASAAEAGDHARSAAPASKAAARTTKAAAKRTTTKKTTKAAAKKTTKAATKKTTTKAAAKKTTKAATKKTTTKAAANPGANTVRAWRAHRAAHPIGSTIEATVEEFSSHGAYARNGNVRIYLPLHLLADPAPRRARDVVTVGETRTFVVHDYDGDRNGVDAGLVPTPDPGPAGDQQQGRSRSGRSTPGRSGTAKKTPAKKTPAQKTPAQKAPAKKTPAKKTPAKKTPAKKTPAKKTPAKKTPAKKTPAKKTPATKAAAKKTTRRPR